jgi:hypothetical protein
MADGYAPLSQKIFHIPIAEIAAVAEPDVELDRWDSQFKHRGDCQIVEGTQETKFCTTIIPGNYDPPKQVLKTMNRDAYLRFARCTAIAVAALMITSCKIRIVVPEGGSVESQSGAYSCAAGKSCDIDVLDFFFDQTFVARPASGYEFKYWKKADRRFCGNTTAPCRVYTAGLNANRDLATVMQSFFESDEVFYLQPVFEQKAIATGCTPPSASYGLTLRGADTAQIGTNLKTGDMAFGRKDLTGPIDALIIVDECSTISAAPATFPPGDPRNTASFNTADPDNAFVMVVSNTVISMTVVKNAVAYRYACSSDVNVFMDCGGLDFDISRKTLTMTNVTVENTDTGSVLTMNGTIIWNQ